MQLSPHFTLAELTASTTAARLGLDNAPEPELLPRLVLLAEMLERIRSTLNVPVIVTSGYRSPPVNRAVGGVTSSDHTQGHAADIVAPRFGSASDVATLLAPMVSVLGIGQLILEGVKGKQWVHVSTRAPERSVNRVLTITDQGLSVGIVRLS
jgi:zinc D-Ala-D-Ala carboxypeptidase